MVDKLILNSRETIFDS